MERRGQGHIEIILAFLLFIFAVSAAIYFFSPTYKGNVAESTIEYAYRAVKGDMQTDLITYYVNLGLSGKPSKITGFIPPPGFVVRDYDGGGLGYNVQGSDLCIDGAGKNVAVIYSSPDIPWNSGNEMTCEVVDAKISSSIAEKVISQKKAEEMQAKYNENYANLKDELQIPAGRDFSFSLVFSSSDKISAERSIPRGVNVYTKSERLEVIKSSGERKFADLIVGIW